MRVFLRGVETLAVSACTFLLITVFAHATETALEKAPKKKPAMQTAASPVRQSVETEKSAAADQALLEELQSAAAADKKAQTEPFSTTEKAVREATSFTYGSVSVDLSFILDFAAAWFSSTDQRPLRGGHSPDNQGFNFQGLEMVVDSAVDPYFGFLGTVILMPESVEVEEAYLYTLALPLNLQLKAGQMLADFGRMNPSHPHTWNFVDPPLVNVAMFTGEGSRSLGAELSLLLPLPWYLELKGQVLQPTTIISNSVGKNDLEGVEDFVYLGRLINFFELSDSWSLWLGGSAMFGPNPSGPDNRTDLYGGDLYLKYRPVGYGRTGFFHIAYTGEFMWRQMQVPEDLVKDWGISNQLEFRWSKRWMNALRYDLLRLFEGDASPYVNEKEWRAGASISFLPTEFSRIRLQYDYSRPEPEETNLYKSGIHAAYLQFEVSVGKHGAHKF